MDFNYKFSNLLGSVYKNGNVLFSGDGNCVITPVGNKISIFDLKNNVSRTLAVESEYNISHMTINRSGSHILVATESGEVLYVNLVTETVVFRFLARRTVNAISFSPDSKCCALTRGGDLQIQEILSAADNAFQPFSLQRTYQFGSGNLTCVEWSSDNRLLVCGGEDSVVRVVGAKAICNFHIRAIAAHKGEVIAAQFIAGSYDLVTVDRRGLANCWKSNLVGSDIIYGEHSKSDEAKEEIKSLFYEKTAKCFVSDSSGVGRSVDVTAARFHSVNNTLVTAFANGVFVIHEVPSFSIIHSLRVSELSVESVDISPTGDWLALGCGRGSQGQLVVWEWQSETYVMKQQSHQLNIRQARFSPDATLLATAGEDGKVKVWNCRSSFCFVTFDEHTSAVTGVAWTQSGKALLSSSLDGTVRAHDLKRYRNFRTLVCPEPTPLTGVVVDPTGDIVVASAEEQFQMFVWSLENGQLLSVLSGHTGNVASFSLKGNALVSVGWDRALRLWNVLESSSESVDLTAEGVAVAFAPTHKVIAALSLDNVVAFFESEDLGQIGTIDAKFDLDSARSEKDKIKKDTSEKSKSFTSLSFSPDSSLLLLGGQSNIFCLYSVQDKLLLRKFTMTINRSMDGVVLDIKRRNFSEFGNMQLVDTSDSEEDEKGKKRIKLAGSKHADKGERSGRPTAEVFHLSFCPTGRRFAVSSTEGVQMYSLDMRHAFDPFNLEFSTSREQIERLLEKKEHASALKASLQLGEDDLIRRCVESVPLSNVPLIASSLSIAYCERLLKWMTQPHGASSSPHLQLYMTWLHALLMEHASALKEKGDMALLTSVQHTIQHLQSLLSTLVRNNKYSLDFLLKARRIKRIAKSEDIMDTS